MPPADPQPATSDRPGVGLALSGGGFRATLFHLGVIAYLHETGRLKDITHITAVSGGSILAAHLVLHWERYTGNDTEFNEASGEVLRFIRLDVRGRILRRIPLYFPLYWFSVFLRRMPVIDENSLGWWTRVSTTDLLRRHYSRHLFKKKKLKHLRGTPAKPRPRLFLLTTSIDEPMQASFTSRGFQIGDETFDCESKDLGLVVAASSAFPGMFPSVLFKPHLGRHERSFRLVDGGVYDNLGVSKFKDLMAKDNVSLREIIVSDASVKFKPADKRSFLEPFTTPIKAADILFKRVYDFEIKRAEQVDRNNQECTFRFVRLMEKLNSEEDELALSGEFQQELHSVRTDLDFFTDVEIFALVRHGYCVARSKLGYGLAVAPADAPQDPANDNVTGDVTVLTAATRPWDPVVSTRNKLARALAERDDDRSDQIIKHLNRSSIRRLRLVAPRDWISYFNFGWIMSIILFFGIGYVLTFLSLIRPTDPNLVKTTGEMLVSHNMSDAAQKYRNVLWDRRRIAKQPNSIAPDSTGNQPIETWTTGQAVYAMLVSGKLEPAEITFLANVLENRFPQPGKTPPSDWDAAGRGWKTRPGVNNLQAEPAIWMLIALCRILQEETLAKPLRDKLSARVPAVQQYLAANKFLVFKDEKLVFNVLANQTDVMSHSAYTTSLGLLALIEMRRARQKWNDAPADGLIEGVIGWFNANYDVKRRSWTSIDNDRELSVDDEAVNLQIMAIMLEAYGEVGLSPNDEFERRINDHLEALDRVPAVDSEARVWLESTNIRGEAENHEVHVRFLSRPWAIRLCRLWLKQASSAVSPPRIEDKVRVLSLLEKLTSGLDKSLELDKDAFTFRSAEMLLALS